MLAPRQGYKGAFCRVRGPRVCVCVCVRCFLARNRPTLLCSQLHKSNSKPSTLSLFLSLMTSTHPVSSSVAVPRVPSSSRSLRHCGVVCWIGPLFWSVWLCCLFSPALTSGPVLSKSLCEYDSYMCCVLATACSCDFLPQFTHPYPMHSSLSVIHQAPPRVCICRHSPCSFSPALDPSLRSIRHWFFSPCLFICLSHFLTLPNPPAPATTAMLWVWERVSRRESSGRGWRGRQGA